MMRHISSIIMVSRLRLVASLFFFVGVVLAYRSSFNDLNVHLPVLPAFLFVLSFVLVVFSVFVAAKRGD